MAEKTLDELILESAHLAVQLRKRLRKGQNDEGPARYYTYVLLLQDECIYVGSSNNIYVRLMEHLHETEMSSNWVREHGPVIRVLEISKNASPDDETYKTLEYMSLFGWQSVRGAGWCKMEVRNPPAALTAFCRDRADFEYLSRREIDEIVAVSRQLYDTMMSE